MPAGYGEFGTAGFASLRLWALGQESLRRLRQPEPGLFWAWRSKPGWRDEVASNAFAPSEVLLHVRLRRLNEPRKSDPKDQ
jgi:hypothetical protein